jgi:hypothetical protein
MNRGHGGRNRDTNTGENLLIFEVIAGVRPRSHRVHRFFNIHEKRESIMQYITYIITDNKYIIQYNKYVHKHIYDYIYNYIYTILYITLYYYTKIISYIQYILYVVCRYAIIWRYQKNRWARWACGLTPRKALIDRTSETSASVPNASTSPQFYDFSIKDNPLKPHISTYIISLVERLATTSKMLKFEEKIP